MCCSNMSPSVSRPSVAPLAVVKTVSPNMNKNSIFNQSEALLRSGAVPQMSFALSAVFSGYEL